MTKTIKSALKRNRRRDKRRTVLWTDKPLSTLQREAREAGGVLHIEVKPLVLNEAKYQSDAEYLPTLKKSDLLDICYERGVEVFPSWTKARILDALGVSS